MATQQHILQNSEAGKDYCELDWEEKCGIHVG